MCADFGTKYSHLVVSPERNSDMSDGRDDEFIRRRIAELEREVEELREANEILKAVASSLVTDAGLVDDPRGGVEPAGTGLAQVAGHVEPAQPPVRSVEPRPERLSAVHDPVVVDEADVAGLQHDTGHR